MACALRSAANTLPDSACSTSYSRPCTCRAGARLPGAARPASWAPPRQGTWLRTFLLPSRLQHTQAASTALADSRGGRFAELGSYDYQELLEGAREESLAEYALLKEQLLRRCQRGGGLLAAYLFLTQSGEVALAALVGAAAGWAYLWLLIQDVDRLRPEDPLPLQAAEAVENPTLRTLAKGLAAYRQALQPRLLVPVSLGACVALYNSTASQPLSGGQEGCLLLGFLCYKAGLLGNIWDDLKPKSLTAEELRRRARPEIPQVEDVDDILNPKKQA